MARLQFSMLRTPVRASTKVPLPWDINTNGATTGWYVDNADVNHGFVRDKHGTIVEFDVPGGFMFPWASIAPNGAVVGVYFDANNVVHGFLREAGQ